MNIAIIGSGISGLGCAYLLSKAHDVTLFEKNKSCGGHSRTIHVSIERETQTVTQPVDTGFIVFNKRNYPHLTGLFDYLNIPYEKSDMSFGVSIKDGWLEYTSRNIFANPANFLKPQFLRMLYEILKFNRLGTRFLKNPTDETLSAFLKRNHFSDWFHDYYILPMGGAIWSCSTETMTDFPARSFLRFFANHGLLTVNDQPQWYTVTGGSRNYVQKILDEMPAKVRTGTAVTSVTQKGKKFEVLANGKAEIYDQVVFACHADQALQIIQDKTPAEQNILGAFSYQKNKLVVHQDDTFMPHRKSCWASWVYLSRSAKDKRETVSLSYWMNNLQNFESDAPIHVTLNPDARPDENTILDEHDFAHPIFDEKAVAAQGHIDDVQGVRGLWFCGAYQRYGFHEDGLLSAVNVARKIGVDIPWE